MQLEAGVAANRACAAFCNCSRLDLACPSKMLPMNDPADGAASSPDPIDGLA